MRKYTDEQLSRVLSEVAIENLDTPMLPRSPNSLVQTRGCLEQAALNVSRSWGGPMDGDRIAAFDSLNDERIVHNVGKFLAWLEYMGMA